MKFETTEELIVQAIRDRACWDGIAWCAGKQLEEILLTVPRSYRVWCLSRGYAQFAEHCDWRRLRGPEWCSLLQVQPQLAEHCDWNKLDGSDWLLLLLEQPQFAQHCDWSKLDGFAWSCLLQEQPQFAQYREQLNEI